MKLVYLFIIFLFFSACNNPHYEAQEKDFIRAQEFLGDRKYEEANTLLAKLVEDYPNNQQYKRYLADSYLGMGGFELLNFLLEIDLLISCSFQSDEFLEELKRFSEKYFLITEERKNSLYKALEIYSVLEQSLESNSREDRLKKGLVNVFLLAQSAKALVKKIASTQIEVEINNDMDDEIKKLELQYKKFVKNYLVYVDEMFYHGFNAYLNFKESFSEINSLLSEVDRALIESFGVPFNEIKEELADMDIKKFTLLFIKYNPKLYKSIMVQIFKTCKKEVILRKVAVLKRAIIDGNKDPRFQQYALKIVDEVEKYVKNHRQDACRIDNNFELASFTF